MSKKRKGEIPLSEPASLVLFDYGGWTVWMEPEKAQELAASIRKRKKRCYIVRRKVVR